MSVTRGGQEKRMVELAINSSNGGVLYSKRRYNINNERESPTITELRTNEDIRAALLIGNPCCIIHIVPFRHLLDAFKIQK